MKCLTLICISLFVFLSCSDRAVRQTLDDVESYIMERPDSALHVLESMDRGLLTTDRSRAQHALLYAMALDKNYIDVTNDSIAKIAVDYYKDNEPKRNYARALCYLGKCYYYRKEYDKAILEFSKAEAVAKSCDSLYLGMIKTAQADTYNKTYNSVEQLRCIKAGLQIFESIGAERYVRSARFSLAMAHHNVAQYAEAIQMYNSIIEQSHVIDNYTIQSYLNSAHSMLETSCVDYEVVLNNFKKVAEIDIGYFKEKDYWAWAYVLYKIGKTIQAENIISNIQISDSTTANLWKSRIAILNDDYKAALEYHNSMIHDENVIVRNILTESLAIYQRDYYQAELEISEYKVRSKSMLIINILISAFLLLMIILLTIRYYIRKQTHEKNKLFEYVAEIKRQLAEANKNDYSALKRKYISLYKTRFETIGSLYDYYVQTEGRVDIESLMFKKVQALICDVQNDASNHLAIEKMLDEDLDMIMSNIRTEMPKLKEVDYCIFSYIIIGFDAVTISRLLDMTVNNVYARKHRLKIKIEEKQPEHMAQFLEILS